MLAKNRSNVLFGAFFLLIGTAFSAVFLDGVTGDLAIFRGEERTRGRLLRVQKGNIEVNDVPERRLTFEYEADGATHRAVSSAYDSGWDSAEAGLEVEVEVARSSPEIARIAGTTRTRGGGFGALLVLVFPVTGACMVLWPFLSRSGRRLRAHEKMKRTPVRRITAGPCKVEGKVVLAKPPLVAPGSGVHCAAYEVEVAEKDDGSWSKVFSTTQATDFYVDDGSGKIAVRVDPNTSFYFGRSGTTSGRTNLPAHLKSGDLKCTVATLRDGDRATVSGIARREVDGTRTLTGPVLVRSL